MTISSTMAEFATGTRGPDVPAEVIEAGRVAIVDCLACIIAGAATDVGRIAAAVAAEGSQGSASVIGTGLTARPRDAALANGTAGHALDLDDISWTMYGHPSVTMVPAGLAIAETRGLGGRDLVEAYVIGVQVAAKLGSFIQPDHYEHGWHSTATVGIFGATAAVCRLMKLDLEKATMAFGIAASQSAGVRRNFGSMTKPFHAGNAAHAAVLAGELAARGMTSDREAIEGRFGWLEVLGGRQAPTAEDLREALASHWVAIEPGIVLKRFPACGATHCAIDAMLELRKVHDLTADNVVSISCRAHPLSKKVLQHSRPTTGLEGKFSMEHAIAVGLVAGHPGLAHFEDGWVQDPRVRAVYERITFEEDARLTNQPAADAVPAHLAVTLTDGRVVETTVAVPIGDPRQPVAAADCRRKFDDCTSSLLSRDRRDRVWERLERLERETELNGLVSLLSPDVAPDRESRAA